MQSIILLLFVTVVVSCSVVPNGSTPMSLSAKVVKEEHRCLSSAGPEIIKNGNFELVSSQNVSYWGDLNAGSIYTNAENNLVELQKNQNISQTLKYRSKGYYVKFDYISEKSQVNLLEVELLGQKLIYSPKKNGNQIFEHVFQGTTNYTLTIKSLSDEKVLIDNISVKPIGTSCLNKIQATSNKDNR